MRRPLARAAANPKTLRFAILISCFALIALSLILYIVLSATSSSSRSASSSTSSQLLRGRSSSSSAKFSNSNYDLRQRKQQQRKEEHRDDDSHREQRVNDDRREDGAAPVVETVPPLLSERRDNDRHRRGAAGGAHADDEEEDRRASSSASVSGKVCALVIDSRTAMRNPTERENNDLVDTVKAVHAALLDESESEDRSGRSGGGARSEQASALSSSPAAAVLVFRPFTQQPTLPIPIFSKSDNIRKQPTSTSTNTVSVQELFLGAPQLERITQVKGVRDRRRQSTNSTFVEAVERILLALETAKQEEHKFKCDSLFVVHAVFSGDEAHIKLKRTISDILGHPSSASAPATQQQDNSNPQLTRKILSPAIWSANAKHSLANIFSFGNDVVELFEGFAWSVPRFYGLPEHYGPAQGDSPSPTPSGTLCYLTPNAFRGAVSPTIDHMFSNPRYRQARLWLETVRANSVTAGMDIPLTKHSLFEAHLVVVDAAMAEFSAVGSRFDVSSHVVVSNVRPLVFTEVAISARYMLSVAHAATGLGAIHLTNSAAETGKMINAPAAWVARVLPFISSIASDLWFRHVASNTITNVTVMWDPYCSCTGINVEAINFLVAMEKYVRLRAVANQQTCWCPGFPTEDQFALRRMGGPKLLNAKSSSHFHVWVSHKPVDAFPASFPYDGAVRYDKRKTTGRGLDGDDGGDRLEGFEFSESHPARPDAVIGRTMIESDRVPQNWVHKLNTQRDLVDELWVPSKFLVDAFYKSGVRKSLPIHVIPEGIDVNFYDPGITKVYREIRPKWMDVPEDCFIFLSNFKWERRKGWDILLRAYFETFRAHDNVVLVLKTFLYMDSDPYNVDKIRNKIYRFVAGQFPDMRKDHYPKVYVLPFTDGSETPAFMMPRIYRGAHAFVLPTRGEGWGLPLQEAMSMGLVTIGTSWGGSVDFMPNDKSGWSHFSLNITGMERADGTPASQQEVDDPARTEPLFASPSVEHLGELMRHVFEMKVEDRLRMGERARLSITAQFSRQAVGSAALHRILDLYNEAKLRSAAAAVADKRN